MSEPFQGERSLSTSSQELKQTEGIDDIEKARIWWKLDVHLVPWVALLYLLCFLDRSNIGNAKIAGMSKDLHLIGLRYNIAAAVFFITYCFVDIPSNIAITFFRPSIWIPSLMLAWGIVTTLISLVNTYQGLVVARLFLGLAEGGLFPGVTYYISMWYPRHMQAKRIAIIPAAASAAGAFGGILAYGIQHMEGIAGLHGWQWIFLLEGLTTVVIALVSYFVMHDYPETAKFLTEDERRFVLQVLREERRGQPTHFSMKFVWQAMTDWKTYMHIIISIGVLVTVYSLALFLPTVIRDLGFSSAGAQLLTVPPFVCSAIATIVVGICSDKMNLRGPFVVLCATVSMIGYIIAYTTSRAGPGYAAVIIGASGVYPTIAVIITWAGGNAGGNLKRAVVIAMVVGIGNLGGICASFIYYQPPRFHTGHGTVIGCLATCIIASSILMWKYRALNKEKEELCHRMGIEGGKEAENCEVGEKSAFFRYVI